MTEATSVRIAWNRVDLVGSILPDPLSLIAKPEARL
jgi:hypothetical protein